MRTMFQTGLACAVVAALVMAPSGAAAEEDIVSSVKWVTAPEPFAQGVGKARCFRAEAQVGEGLKSAVAHWWFDDSGALWVDGRRLSQDNSGKGVDLTAAFAAPGRHLVAVRATNLAGVGGVCLAVHFTYIDGRVEVFHTSSDWRCSTVEAAGWMQNDFDDSGWQPVRVHDDALAAPWVALRDMAEFMPVAERARLRDIRARHELRLAAAMKAIAQEPKPQCRIVYERGLPRFDVGGRRFETVFYNVSEDWHGENRRLRRQVEAFRDAGMHVYGLGVDTLKVWREDGTIDFAALEAPMRSALAIDPEARFMFCICTCMPPKWWVASHPNELVGYQNGVVNPKETRSLKNPAVPSMASEAWRRDMADYETRLVRYLEDSPFAARIIAYRTDYGINHEWHYYGMRNLMPDNGLAMTRAFRAWLRRAYDGDVEALRRAWNDSAATFERAELPSMEARLRTSAELGMRDAERDRMALDYERCHAAVLRDCLLAFNRAVKEACGGRALVGNYCGYFFALPEAAEGCHLENDAILDSPWVDFQSGPFCYGPDQRKLGAPQYARALLEGTRSRGKLSLMESDNSTSVADNQYCRYSSNYEEDLALLARDFVSTLCWGCGLWYYDFGQGWYADTVYADFFRRLLPIRARQADCTSAAEILVVGDYESIMFTNVAYPAKRHLQEATVQITELGHSGVPFDTASFADLAAGRLKEYRIYFFPNLHHVTPAKRAVLERLRAAGKRIVWPADPDGAMTVPVTRHVWRGICTESGVHIYNDDGEASLYANAGYVGLHVGKAGRQTIRLPRAAHVSELYPVQREIGESIAEFAFDAPGPGTWLFATDR